MVSNLFSITEKRMKASADGFKQELATIRTGRANPAMIEHLKVDYQGVTLPLNQIASISAPEARLLLIQPWDPTSMRSIEQAILKSDLSIHPINDGRVIRLNVPPLSEERRQELIKIVRRRAEERRVALRNLRRDAIEELRKLEKSKTISQDEQKRALDQLQKLTDGFIAAVGKTEQDKEKELKEV